MFSSFHRTLARIRAVFHSNDLDRDLVLELESHIQILVEQHIRKGASREEAQRLARIELGGIAQLREAHREVRALPLPDAVLQDIRFAFRMLRKSPGFTTVAVFTLALGIGANTAIFSLLHASLWSPLPVSDPKEIFHLMRSSSEGDFAGESSYSYPLFQQFSKTAAPFGEVFATEVVGPRKFGLNGVSDQRIAGEAVSGNFFSVLNVGPIVGRVLEPHDDNVLGGNHVAVLSYALWRRRFQADTSILGKTILYDETPYTVVGVARPGFFGIEPGESVDVWVPATPVPDPNVIWLWFLVRLHRGVGPAQAQAKFEAAFRAHVADVLLPSASPRFKQMLIAQHITVRLFVSDTATTE